MGFKTVVIECTVRDIQLPAGTVDSLFRFEILEVGTGSVISFVETANPGGSFPLIPEGFSYIARITKNGVSVEQQFDLPVTTFSVPDVITITF